jgi:dihydroflavonol-4-reductase
MTTLVTGGTGFLGEHLVRTLAARGETVRVAVRGTYEPPRVDPQGDGSVQILHTDVIADPAHRADGLPLAEALAGCATVYHLAGSVSRDPAAGQTMMRIHVDGTRRVLEAAKAAGVRRVVVASSSGTLAVSKTAEPIPDETWPHATELVARWPYYLSKIYQEKLALDLGRELGLEVVIVNPSLLLGPGDRRQSSTGDVLRFLRRQIPSVPSGGLSFVDARDAAEATVAAMERGRPGERYLLGGPNWTFAEFFGRLERASKVRAPFLRLPSSLSRHAASLMEQVYKKLDRDPPVDRVSVEMAELFWYCDSTRAKNELGFEARDPAETLDATIRYLRTHARI